MREGWEYKKLGEVCNVYAGQGAPQGDSNYSDVGTPFIKAGNLSELISGIQESEFQKVSQEVASAHKLKLYKKGSVLFAKSGMSCMKNYIYTLKSDCYVVSHLAILEPYNIESKYLQYYLEYKKPNSLVKDESYPSIALKDIQNMPIVFPQDKSQEQSIVSELDKINELISLKKEQLKDYDNLAQSIFYDMFGDPVANDKGWEIKKLQDICNKIGSGATPRGGNKSYKSEGISLIRSMNVYNNMFNYKDLAFIDEEQATALSNVEVYANDVLLNITGASVARCCIVPDDVLPARVNQHVCILRPTSSVGSLFLNYIITNTSFQIFLLATAKSKAATREALPKNIIDNLFIPLPPLPLQQAFAKRIEAIEQQKQLISSEIKDLETLLASRMQYWFD